MIMIIIIRIIIIKNLFSSPSAWLLISWDGDGEREIMIIIILTETTFEYVECGPDRNAPEVVWNTSLYI